jgi:hypothetical protein
MFIRQCKHAAKSRYFFISGGSVSIRNCSRFGANRRHRIPFFDPITPAHLLISAKKRRGANFVDLESEAEND